MKQSPEKMEKIYVSNDSVEDGLSSFIHEYGTPQRMVIQTEPANQDQTQPNLGSPDSGTNARQEIA